MSNKLDNLNCFLGNGGNVGQGTCGFTPGLLIGNIFGPVAAEFAAADVVDDVAMLAALQDGAKEDVYADRLFPIKRYRDWSQGGETAQVQTFGDGTKRETRAATMQMESTIYGDLHYHAGVQKTLHKKHSSFGAMDVYNQGDGTYAVVGRKAITTAGERTMGYFPLSNLTVSNYVYPTGSTTGSFMVGVGYNDAQQHDGDIRVMLFDTNPLDAIEALISAEITAPSPSASATSVAIKVFDSYGIDLHSLYATELASATAFKAYNDDPGSVNRGNQITVSGVASTSLGWTLTLAATGTDPDNPGTGKYVRIVGGPPSALLGLGVDNIELIETRVKLG